MTPGRIKATVLTCHFAGAFGPMGMPPFLALILVGIAPGASEQVIGWLYVIPTACLAISAPFWGRMSDRWGRKPLLLRAQIGLALSLALAGMAGSLPLFVAALCLQGLLGGTFSASNAYLSEALPRSELSQALNLTQASARLALILAPAAVGLLVDNQMVPQRVYLVVALLPMIAALMLLPLPGKAAPQLKAAATGNTEPHNGRPVLARNAVMTAQIGFTIAMVSTFPFLVPYSMKTFGVGAGIAGWLFGLPHLVYLFACIPLGRYLRSRDPAPWLAAGCAIVGAMLVAQLLTSSLAVFAAARLALGLGMTFGYIALNVLISDVIETANAGKIFGWFDSGAKLATIVAGVGGGMIAASTNVETLFMFAAVFGFLTAIAVMMQRRSAGFMRSATAK